MEKTEKRSMTKKGHKKFLALKQKLFLKKGHSKNLVGKHFFCPPKLGARSPPMGYTIHKLFALSSNKFFMMVSKTNNRFKTKTGFNIPSLVPPLLNLGSAKKSFLASLIVFS